MPQTSNPERQLLIQDENQSAANTWEGIGFAEFPVVTASLKRPSFETLEYLEDLGQDENGKDLHCVWKLVGSKEYGHASAELRRREARDHVPAIGASTSGRSQASLQ